MARLHKELNRTLANQAPMAPGLQARIVSPCPKTYLPTLVSNVTWLKACMRAYEIAPCNLRDSEHTTQLRVDRRCKRAATFFLIKCDSDRTECGCEVIWLNPSRPGAIPGQCTLETIIKRHQTDAYASALWYLHSTTHESREAQGRRKCAISNQLKCRPTYPHIHHFARSIVFDFVCAEWDSVTEHFAQGSNWPTA